MRLPFVNLIYSIYLIKDLHVYTSKYIIEDDNEVIYESFLNSFKILNSYSYNSEFKFL